MGEKRGTTALQLWCRKMVEGYVDVNIYNMTTSWRDGRAFCALVNKCASLRHLPDLIDFENLKKEDIYENNEKAFRIAEEYFNIPSLLDPHDMVKYEVPDKLSVLTYLSQFYQVFGSYDIGLKNRETSSDDNNDSKKSQPTAPQMAHSVPRREPCFNCNNPVFFAERLVINSMLYHRSCFRCARCHSTLTLGNFYETETENEFCCETCPDEEKKYANNDSISIELNQSDDFESISDVKDSSSVNEKCDEEFEELYRQSTQDDVKPIPSLNASNVDKSSNHSVVHASEISPEKLLKVQLNDEETIKDNETENEISTGIESEVTLKQDENVDTLSDSEEKNEEVEEKRRSIVVENEPSENSEHSVVQQNELIEQSDEAAREELQLSNNNDDECVAAVDNDQPEDKIETINESEDNDTQLRHEHEQQDVINSESETRKCEKKPIPTPRCLNPFGDFDDDEVENMEKSIINNSQKIHYKKELNPFGSESDDEDFSSNKPPVSTRNSISKDPFTSSTPSPHTNGNRKTNDSSSKFSSTKKKRAPKPPTPKLNEIFSQAPVEKSPNFNTTRKKRPAPTPPSSVEKEHKSLPIKNSNDEEKRSQHENESSLLSQTILEEVEHDQIQFRRKISLDESLQSFEPTTSIDSMKDTEGSRRRKILFGSDSKTNNFENDKNEKDISNLNLRYSMETSTISEDQDEPTSISMLNKSSHGKWKRRKDRPAPIPGFAQPQRRILQMLPLQDIRQELEKIEIQQQGLEKQGVILEKMIRERCENETDNKTADSVSQTSEKSEKEPQNSKEVEDLIIQLFELVNEKNELFRRQAELMYLRREYRLEEEQADVEYEIRKLLSQPENNKTDHDKLREENLIQRLVEIVSQRNEIVDCLDRDRLREFEEDKSIKDRLETHTAQIEKLHNSSPSTSASLSKKEKKKMKELKKLKNKKFDDDKDLDTTEAKPKKSEKKKKLAFFKRSKD